MVIKLWTGGGCRRGVPSCAAPQAKFFQYSAPKCATLGIRYANMALPAHLIFPVPSIFWKCGTVGTLNELHIYRPTMCLRSYYVAIFCLNVFLEELYLLKTSIVFWEIYFVKFWHIFFKFEFEFLLWRKHDFGLFRDTRKTKQFIE